MDLLYIVNGEKTISKVALCACRCAKNQCKTRWFVFELILKTFSHLSTLDIILYFQNMFIDMVDFSMKRIRTSIVYRVIDLVEWLFATMQTPIVKPSVVTFEHWKDWTKGDIFAIVCHSCVCIDSKGKAKQGVTNKPKAAITSEVCLFTVSNGRRSSLYWLRCCCRWWRIGLRHNLGSLFDRQCVSNKANCCR